MDLSPIGVASDAAFLMAAGVLIVFVWPRRLVDRYDFFVAAPPQTVWETYFVHVKKADYRPGTRVLDAEILSQEPLTVRLKLQFNYAAAPVEQVLVYDLYEPFARYRLRARDGGGGIVEEGDLTPEEGGTRLRISITGKRRGWVLPALVRRRVKRNQQALKAVCEGRDPEPPSPPLPQPPGWLIWVVLASLAAPWLRLPWQVQLLLATAGCCAGLFYLWRFVTLLVRL